MSKLRRSRPRRCSYRWRKGSFTLGNVRRVSKVISWDKRISSATKVVAACLPTSMPTIAMRWGSRQRLSCTRVRQVWLPPSGTWRRLPRTGQWVVLLSRRSWTWSDVKGRTNPWSKRPWWSSMVLRSRNSRTTGMLGLLKIAMWILALSNSLVLLLMPLTIPWFSSCSSRCSHNP